MPRNEKFHIFPGSWLKKNITPAPNFLPARQQMKLSICAEINKLLLLRNFVQMKTEKDWS